MLPVTNEVDSVVEVVKDVICSVEVLGSVVTDVVP